MNDVQRAPGRALPQGDDLDGLLRRFFRSEMPDPWPAPPRVADDGGPVLALVVQRDPKPASGRRWFRHSGRLAVAAGVSFFLLGYLALTSAFPRHTPAGTTVAPAFGRGLEVTPIRDRVPLKGGGEAEINGRLSRDPKTNQFRKLEMRLERVQ